MHPFNPLRLQPLLVRHPYASLLLLIALVYLPFMGEMMLRTTGDEKTYVAQALEMERDGTWFAQSLADEPNYYKGPLHFLLLRAGFALFGHETMWATLYMNFLGLCLASVALLTLFRREMGTERGWDLFYAAGFALSIGVYAHMFASQMEALLISLYALSLFLLWQLHRRPESFAAHLALWSVIALAGWLKSPLHSFLLGSGVVLFWLISGQLSAYLRRWQSWGAVAWGIGLCVAGYLPAYLLDGEHFVQSYILRESLGKSGGNGVPFEMGFVPVLTYFLFPWVLPALAAYGTGLHLLLRRTSPLEANEKLLLTLAFALALPTLLFFTLHPYRGDIYALPAVSFVWLAVVVLWRRGAGRFPRLFRSAVIASGLLFAAIAALVALFTLKISALPAWWPPYLLPAAALSALLTPALVVLFSAKGRSMPVLAAALLPVYWTLGLFLHTLGEGEMHDLKTAISAGTFREPLGYYNLQHHTWSEWGYLNFWVGYPVEGLHTPDRLLGTLESGRTVLVPGDKPLETLRELVAQAAPGAALVITPWTRWKTHGKDPHTGQSVWAAFWRDGDLARIERPYYLVRLSR